MDALCEGLKATGIIDQATHDDVVALGGGMRYPDLNEAGVQVNRDEDSRIAEKDRQCEKYDELFNAYVSPFLDGQETDANIAIALRNLADAYEA